MSENKYSFQISPMDVWLALDREANKAKDEGMTSVEKPCRAAALHIRNAHAKMSDLCPPDYRVRTRIVFDLVPDVNAVLRDDVREGRA